MTIPISLTISLCDFNFIVVTLHGKFVLNFEYDSGRKLTKFFLFSIGSKCSRIKPTITVRHT